MSKKPAKKPYIPNLLSYFVKSVYNTPSDGSGPKKSSPGRAQALNVKLGPGPGLSPSLKAGPRAGPGGLAGLTLLLINPKNINFTQNSSKVKFWNFIRMLEK